MPAPPRAVPLAGAVASTPLAIAAGCTKSPEAPAGKDLILRGHEHLHCIRSR